MSGPKGNENEVVKRGRKIITLIRTPSSKPPHIKLNIQMVKENVDS